MNTGLAILCRVNLGKEQLQKKASASKRAHIDIGASHRLLMLNKGRTSIWTYLINSRFSASVIMATSVGLASYDKY